jgi:hypothetical protein
MPPAAASPSPTSRPSPDPAEIPSVADSVCVDLVPPPVVPSSGLPAPTISPSGLPAHTVPSSGVPSASVPPLDSSVPAPPLDSSAAAPALMPISGAKNTVPSLLLAPTTFVEAPSHESDAGVATTSKKAPRKPPAKKGQKKTPAKKTPAKKAQAKKTPAKRGAQSRSKRFSGKYVVTNFSLFSYQTYTLLDLSALKNGERGTKTWMPRRSKVTIVN